MQIPASHCTRRGLDGKHSGCQSLEQTTQGSGGIVILGSVQKSSGCGTWGHGLVVDLVVLGQHLELMVLEVSSNLNDSINFLPADETPFSNSSN